jgi:hypothetical protein
MSHGCPDISAFSFTLASKAAASADNGRFSEQGVKNLKHQFMTKPPFPAERAKGFPEIFQALPQPKEFEECFWGRAGE